MDNVAAYFGVYQRINRADDEHRDMLEEIVIQHYLVEFAAVDVRAHQILDKQIDVTLPQNTQCRIGTGGVDKFMACPAKQKLEQVKNFRFGVQTQNFCHA